MPRRTPKWRYDDKDLYKELGDNFRLTLRWRELLFAGFLAISGALSIGFYKLVTPIEPITESRALKVPPKTTESPQDHKINERGSFASKFAWVIPLVGSAFAFGFLLLDRRCHEVLLGNYKLGKELEQWKTGYYSTARERGKRPKQITHTAVLESIYFTSGVVFLSLAAFWIFADNPVEAATNAKIPDDVKENIASGVLLLVKSLPGLILSFLGYKLLSPNVSALTELKEPCIKEVMKKIQCAQIAGGIISGIGIVFIFLVTCGYLKG